MDTKNEASSMSSRRETNSLICLECRGQGANEDRVVYWPCCVVDAYSHRAFSAFVDHNCSDLHGGMWINDWRNIIMCSFKLFTRDIDGFHPNEYPEVLIRDGSNGFNFMIPSRHVDTGARVK